MVTDMIALRTFYCVGRLGGIGAAARELHISQAAVSQRLAKLEKSLGNVLRGKAGRRKILTEDGRILFESCRRAFEIIDAAVAPAARKADSPLIGEVRIAAISELAKAFLFPVIMKFRAVHPAVALEIQYRQPYEMLSLLSKHEIDIAISNESYRRPLIQEVPLFKERIICVGSRPARNFSWRGIENLSWMGYGSDDPLWFEFTRLAAKHGATLPHPMLHVADVDSILRLASAGAGFALAPEHAVAIRDLRNLTTHKLPCRMSHQINLCKLRTIPLAPAAEAFWRSIISHRQRHS